MRRQALTSDPQPLSVFPEVRESHLPPFGKSSPAGSVVFLAEKDVLSDQRITVENTFVIVCSFSFFFFFILFLFFPHTVALGTFEAFEGGLLGIQRGGALVSGLDNELEYILRVGSWKM